MTDKRQMGHAHTHTKVVDCMGHNSKTETVDNPKIIVSAHVHQTYLEWQQCREQIHTSILILFHDDSKKLLNYI